jgi:hypothetical protein
LQKIELEIAELPVKLKSEAVYCTICEAHRPRVNNTRKVLPLDIQHLVDPGKEHRICIGCLENGKLMDSSVHIESRVRFPQPVCIHETSLVSA